MSTPIVVGDLSGRVAPGFPNRTACEHRNRLDPGCGVPKTGVAKCLSRGALDGWVAGAQFGARAKTGL